MPAEDCPYSEMGQDCSFRCVLCNLRHECIYCGFKERQKTCSTCVSPFRDPCDRPTSTPTPHFNIINNNHEYFSDASDKDVGQLHQHGISAVQLEEISQEHQEHAAVNDARDDEILLQTRLLYRPEDPDQEHEVSSLEANEYDEDEIVSQAESDLLAGYACVLCDEPDETEDSKLCLLFDFLLIWTSLSSRNISHEDLISGHVS